MDSLFVDIPVSTFMRVLVALRMGYASACELDISEDENIPKKTIASVYESLRELRPEETAAADKVMGTDLKNVIVL